MQLNNAGIYKNVTLKNGNDSYCVSAQFDSQNPLMVLRVTHHCNSQNQSSQHIIEIKTNKEISELFLKLSDIMYWDLKQIEEDRIKLKELLLKYFDKIKQRSPKHHNSKLSDIHIRRNHPPLQISEQLKTSKY